MRLQPARSARALVRPPAPMARSTRLPLWLDYAPTLVARPHPARHLAAVRLPLLGPVLVLLQLAPCPVTRPLALGGGLDVAFDFPLLPFFVNFVLVFELELISFADVGWLLFMHDE